METATPGAVALASGCARAATAVNAASTVWHGGRLAETYRKGAGVERIECRHSINNDEPVNVELQLHQQLFAEGVDEVGGVGSTSHMADLDTCAGDLGQVHIVQLGIKARQSVFDGAQRFQHLPGQEELGPPLCLPLWSACRQSTSQACAAPTVSAILAPRLPIGLGCPMVLSWAVWCSISALSLAPSRTTMIEIQIQVMKPTTAPSEP
jgi:hypothetical protein